MMDIQIQDHGSIVLLAPKSERGEAWLFKHIVGDDVIRWNGAIVCEPRYVEPILDGMEYDGLIIG